MRGMWTSCVSSKSHHVQDRSRRFSAFQNFHRPSSALTVPTEIMFQKQRSRNGKRQPYWKRCYLDLHWTFNQGYFRLTPWQAHLWEGIKYLAIIYILHWFDLFYMDFIQVLSLWSPTNGIVTYKDYFKQYLKEKRRTWPFHTYEVPDSRKGMRTPSTTTIFFTLGFAKVFFDLVWTALR